MSQNASQDLHKGLDFGLVSLEVLQSLFDLEQYPLISELTHRFTITTAAAQEEERAAKPLRSIKQVLVHMCKQDYVLCILYKVVLCNVLLGVYQYNEVSYN